MTTNPIGLTVEFRSADGTSTECYHTDEACIQEALRLLSNPRLFAQPHLLVASKQCASILPCKGIDMIFARTSGPVPLKFPLNLPVGVFEIVEQPEDFADKRPAAIEECPDPKKSNWRSSLVEIRTLGGWSVTLRGTAVIRGNVQDERQLFSHLPEVPTIPFRLVEGGFGLINTANITRASASPKPQALPGIPLPLIMRQRSSPRCGGGKTVLID